jgi:predicted enzyme related to lactoylglutathione lyase
MKEDSMKHGAFGWMELMTTNMEGAKDFYSKLFGWEITDASTEGMPYMVVKINGDDTGGIMPMPADVAGMPPMWSMYVTVDDIDATAKKVEQLGGKIMRPPSDIPNVGRFCVLSDPQGAVIMAMAWAAKSS